VRFAVGPWLAFVLSVAGATGIHRLEAEAHRPESLVRTPARRPAPLVPRPETTITRNVYGYMPYWADQQHLHFDLLTHIGIFDVTLNPDGSITNGNNFPGTWAATIDRAHRNGVKCELVATCFGWYNIHEAIRAPNSIPNLIALAESAGMDGINMDFEEILGADRDTMVLFMQALSRACRGAGLELTMATMPLDFQNAYDFAALADTTDGLFIMGYNYHWQGGPEAGPVAPLSGWPFYGNLQMTIDQYLAQTGDARKLYFGLPYYGFQWPTHAESTHAGTAGYGEALYYADAPGRAAARGCRWDAESQTPWYAFNNGGWNQGWFDDDTSLLLKYQKVHDYDFLGTGMWALGYDAARTELWAALRESFNRPLGAFANGDCETWCLDTLAVPSDTSANAAGWYEGRKAKFRRETATVRSGASAIRHSPDSLGYPWPVESRIFQDVRVEPSAGCELRACAYKNDGRGNRLKLVIDWYDSTHRVIGSAASPELTRDSAAWVEISTGLVPAPSGTEFARLSLWMLGFGGYDCWDDISFDDYVGVADASALHHSTPFSLHPSIIPSFNPSVPSSLFAPSGRLVRAGPLAPGVYFLRGPLGTRKVIVPR
jgi:hypothetical protein